VKKLMLPLLILFVVVPGSALGVDGEDRANNYFAAKAGLYTPTDDLEEDEFDSGFNGEVAFGHYFHPNVAFELGLGYFKTEANLSGRLPLAGSYTEDDEVTVIPLTATVKGAWSAGIAEFYGGGGVGLYTAEVEIYAVSQNLPPLSIRDEDTVFGVHLLAGVNFDITEKIFLGIEGKQIWTQQAAFEGVFLKVPVTTETNLDGFMVTGNIGFRF
jgi:outer membrane protein W